MPAVAEAVTERLENTWLKWWGCSLAAGIVLVASASFGMLAILILADALCRFPQLVLGVLFLLWAVTTIAMIAGMLVHLRCGQRSLAATARRLEMEFPELGSHLINLVQFTQRDGVPSDPFREAALAQAAAAVSDFPLESAAVKETRFRRFALCMQTPRDLLEASCVLVGILVAACFLHSAIPAWSSSTSRLLQPWKFVPAVGSVQITQVIPGDTEVLIGSSLEITAQIKNPDSQALPATLYLRRDQQPEAAQPLIADEKNEKFTAVLPQVLGPLQYRLEIGDSQTKAYKVAVREKPTVTDVEVVYQYPPYLNRPNDTVAQKHGDLEAPQFTRAELRFHASTAIVRGFLRLGGHDIHGRVLEDGSTLLVSLFLDETNTYTVHLFTEAGHTDPEPRVNRIRVLPDAPPTVQIVEPAREARAAVGKKIALVVRATDDYGLGLVRLECKQGETGSITKVAAWDTFGTPTQALLHHVFFLDPAHYKPGLTLFIRASARDRRHVEVGGVSLMPQETTSPWQQITLIASEAKTAEELAQLDLLRIAIGKILQEQIKARIAAAQIPRQPSADDGNDLTGGVRSAQIGIHKATAAVIASIGQTDDKDRLTIKRVLNKLALGDMLEAVRQVEALAKSDTPTTSTQSVAALSATQDRIIDVLSRLLNEIRRGSAELLSELKKKGSTELPPDVQSKLRELKDKLQEFLKQQKKVIEATENLAKKPVEDFTVKEKQLLKELAAKQDDWSRFLADKNSDLSKLPEQDFANPSLLKELVEVQTALKMAEDALTKKTADIAVPLEQLGAEMAKEITTNIEKWLPDTPDRERWSQEEPLTDAMKEAPMAELPKELEDLVGELMEKEEDLFDEMEDKSSSWADSIDKGAGWDAADGPISNNSARGVTGNRLPNTSEIAGRSGEGRQGKASGEFVSDTAVGKGGRKTPSRLTPDAHVKGQVKDVSKDPVGGATGGGKESGQGGEGLHGPVPNRPERQLQRLADKQAQLRNKAESVDLRFKVLRYHHTDLKQLIGIMAAVERDLRGGQYQSALRRREVLLEGLGQVKMYLKGEFTIRQDQTSNLPTDIQKEILGSMQESSPPGWEELNRLYYERLSAEKGAVAPSTQPLPPAATRPSSPKSGKE
ncbi:MAG TPA: hypothetical protein VK395_30595 [Gemmataceae bacterium]|nr:hypothetical protein [Gemmataceae bacterium]